MISLDDLRQSAERVKTAPESGRGKGRKPQTEDET